MELDVLAHSHSVLREHLQRINKQKEIELYYELLSSGHSVGEILHSLGSIQRESEHGNVATADTFYAAAWCVRDTALGLAGGLLLINWQIDGKGSSGANTSWGNKIQVRNW